MKGLLLAIQARLREITGIRDKEIFLSPDPDVVTGTMKFPCIGIKDGKLRRSFLAGGAVELILPVEIYIYEKLDKPGKAIETVLDLADDVHDKLDDHDFSGYVKDVEPGNETPNQLMYLKSGMILRRGLFFQYEREEA